MYRTCVQHILICYSKLHKLSVRKTTLCICVLHHSKPRAQCGVHYTPEETTLCGLCTLWLCSCQYRVAVVSMDTRVRVHSHLDYDLGKYRSVPSTSLPLNILGWWSDSRAYISIIGECSVCLVEGKVESNFVSLYKLGNSTAVYRLVEGVVMHTTLPVTGLIQLHNA